MSASLEAEIRISANTEIRKSGILIFSIDDG
jgi:hypothetical protein